MASTTNRVLNLKYWVVVGVILCHVLCVFFVFFCFFKGEGRKDSVSGKKVKMEYKCEGKRGQIRKERGGRTEMTGSKDVDKSAGGGM